MPPSPSNIPDEMTNESPTRCSPVDSSYNDEMMDNTSTACCPDPEALDADSEIEDDRPDPPFSRYFTTAGEALTFVGGHFEPIFTQNVIDTNNLFLPVFCSASDGELHSIGAGVNGCSQDIDIDAHLIERDSPIHNTEGDIEIQSNFCSLVNEIVDPHVASVTGEEYRYPLIDEAEPEPELEPQPQSQLQLWPWPKEKPCYKFESEDQSTWKAWRERSEIPNAKSFRRLVRHRCNRCGWWFLIKKTRDRCQGDQEFRCLKNGCPAVFNRADNRLRHRRKCTYGTVQKIGKTQATAKSEHCDRVSSSEAQYHRHGQGLSSQEHDSEPSRASKHIQHDGVVPADPWTLRAASCFDADQDQFMHQYFDVHQYFDERPWDSGLREPRVGAAGSSVRASASISEDFHFDIDETELEHDQQGTNVYGLSSTAYHRCADGVLENESQDHEMPDEELQVQQAVMDSIRVNKYGPGRSIDPDSLQNARNKRRAK